MSTIADGNQDDCEFQVSQCSVGIRKSQESALNDLTPFLGMAFTLSRPLAETVTVLVVEMFQVYNALTKKATRQANQLISPIRLFVLRVIPHL